MTHKRRDNGLSLLEVLVAMTLLSLIGVLVGGAVGFGRTAWDRTETHGDAQAEIRVVQGFLRRQLEQIRVIRMRDGSRAPPVFFTGASDGMTFIAPIAARAAPPGDRLVVLGMGMQGLPQDTLAVRFLDPGPGRPQIGPGGIREPLMDMVSGLGLRYFGPLPDAETMGWQPEWRDRPTLPRLVEITVRFEAPHRVWPPLVVALPQAPGGGSG